MGRGRIELERRAPSRCVKCRVQTRKRHAGKGLLNPRRRAARYDAEMNDARPAVVLLSGGLDSATVLGMARADGFVLHALTFRYGQRHQREVECARRIAQREQVARHLVLEVGLGQFGGSALTADLAVPKGRAHVEHSQEIPITYVPARNLVFLAHAVAWAETLGARDIFLGVNAVDYSGYPDCRPEFVTAFERAANLGTRVGQDELTRLRIHAPLAALRKAEIIACGVKLGIDYGLTTSCYDPNTEGAACGECDACLLRRRGFTEAGLPDPIRYSTVSTAP